MQHFINFLLWIFFRISQSPSPREAGRGGEGGEEEEAELGRGERRRRWGGEEGGGSREEQVVNTSLGSLCALFHLYRFALVTAEA